MFGLEPTGREGTSVETILLTIRGNRVIHIHVGDNSLDLVLYRWDRGWLHPHNVRPEALVIGVERPGCSRLDGPPTRRDLGNSSVFFVRYSGGWIELPSGKVSNVRLHVRAVGAVS